MYEARFGMKGLPFQLSPDPTFYFDSRGHHRTLADLRSVVGRGSGFIVISGEIGAGKTTLVRALTDGLEPGRLKVAHLVSTQLAADELLSAVAIAFGLRVEAARPDSHAAQLLSFLLSESRQSGGVLLVIDEAQHLDADGLHRLLALLRYGASRLSLQVCLAGQPELKDVLSTPGLETVRQQVLLSCHLGPIAPDETGPYIEHRLRKVGWSGLPRFAPEVFDEIHRSTGGIPRRVNVLCNRLLLTSFLESHDIVDAATVSRVARELGAELDGVSALPAAWSRKDLPLPSAPLPAVERSHAPVLTLHRPARPMLCVVADDGDHARAAALLRAFAERPDAPPVKLVRVHDDEAFARTAPLFEGIVGFGGAIVLGKGPEAHPQPAEALEDSFRSVVLRARPRAVAVFGGGTATFACGKVADESGVPLIHVGAGPRGDEGEAQTSLLRRNTDALAELLYTVDAEASGALVADGVPPERVHCVGNLLVDAMRLALSEFTASTSVPVCPTSAGPVFAERGVYALVVVDHPRNIEQREALREVLGILRELARDISLLWPMQPRLLAQMDRYRLDGFVDAAGICQLPMQPFIDQVALVRNAACIVTDSWDLQDEATALSVPCITIGAVPGRAVTLSIGSNRLAGCNRVLATRLLWDCLFSGGRRGRVPELWDGKTGGRIAGYLCPWLRDCVADRLDRR
jgi:UDP-N-acetylglucosamine 2-epimerase